MAAGAFGISFTIFILASAVGRSARFFLVCNNLLVGPSVKAQIDKHFNLFTVLFTIALFAGFAMIRMLK